MLKLVGGVRSQDAGAGLSQIDLESCKFIGQCHYFLNVPLFLVLFIC